MATGNLTEKQIWLQRHGFYGHWWDLVGLIPYRGDEYHRQLKECLEEYEKRWVKIDC